MTITGGSALPKDDIERMMREAEPYAEEDKKRREDGRDPQQGRALVYQTEKFLARERRQGPGRHQDRGRRGARRAEEDARGHRHRRDPRRGREARHGQPEDGRGDLRPAAGGRRRRGRPAGATATRRPGADDDVVDAEIVDDEPKREAARSDGRGAEGSAS